MGIEKPSRYLYPQAWAERSIEEHKERLDQLHDLIKKIQTELDRLEEVKANRVGRPKSTGGLQREKIQ